MYVCVCVFSPNYHSYLLIFLISSIYFFSYSWKESRETKKIPDMCFHLEAKPRVQGLNYTTLEECVSAPKIHLQYKKNDLLKAMVGALF